MLSRKYYRMIANAISRTEAYMDNRNEPSLSKQSLIWNLIEDFEEDNPNFDKEKFEEACYK